MGRLRLYAISADTLASFRGRGGDPARLRAVAADRFGFGRVRRPSLLGKLGPLVRDPLPVDSDVALPTRADVELLLSGAQPAPDRLERAWTIIGCWLDATATARLVVPFDGAESANPNDDGVPAAPLTIGALLRSPAPLDLTPLPGMAVGFAAGLQPWRSAARRAPHAEGVAEDVRRWLQQLPDDVVAADGLLAIAATAPPMGHFTNDRITLWPK